MYKHKSGLVGVFMSFDSLSSSMMISPTRDRDRDRDTQMVGFSYAYMANKKKLSILCDFSFYYIIFLFDLLNERESK